MNRFITFSKLFIFGFLFLSFQNLYPQNPLELEDILKKYNINPSEIPAENLGKIETRVQTLQTEGSSEEEIIAALRAEGLLPAARADTTEAAKPEIAPKNPPIKEQTEASSGDVASTIKPRPKPGPPPANPLHAIFGHNIFQDTTGAFIRAIPTTPSDNYIVGSGDAFNVTIWGCSELSESLVVEGDGSISRPYMGKIYIGGMTYKEAQSALMRNYRKFISSCSQIEIFMGKSKRTITVNIVGEIFRPGAYTLNAAIPAFNALFEAGGVTEKGSVRNISIKRDGKVVQILDVYEYLIAGEDKPIFLQNNDFIFVPVQDKIVRISGAVERESQFELREDENLKSLILFSGGLSFFARTEKARIDRFELGESNVINFELEKFLGKDNPDYPLIEGDHVQIRAENLSLRSYVGIRGSVKFADNYQFESGDRVSDLIDRAGGLEEDALLGQAYLMRRKIGTIDLTYIPVDLAQVVAKNPAANIPIQNRDVLHVFSNLRLTEARSIAISGEVRNPGVFENAPDLNLKTLLYLANGPKKTANYHNIELFFIPDIDDIPVEKINNFIEASDPLSPAYRNKVEFTHRVSLRENWQTDPNLESILLFPFNHIHIYSKYDFVQYEKVSIEGSVVEPGTFRVMEDMNLKDLIYLAKGIAQGNDKVEVELHRKISIGEKGNFGTKQTDNKIFRFTLDRDWESSQDIENVSLENIERVLVISEKAFAEQTYIQIKGEVGRPGTYLLTPNMSLQDLLYQAEGINLQADFENIELTRIIEVEGSDGKITPTPLVQRRIATLQDWQKDSSLSQVFINAFDQIFIRRNPDFQLQESVFLEGEFISPGEYNKIRKNERISSLVKRANGPSELADVEGAYIMRAGISGPISLRLKKALANPGGKYDIALLEGDQLIIPPLKNTVTINGNVLQSGVTVIYEKGKKRYKYYVRKYAGGFSKKTLKRSNTIVYADGSVRGPVRFFWKTFYPKVEQGSTIQVARKPEKVKKEKEGDGRIRINTQELIASLTAILTFAILLRNSNN